MKGSGHERGQVRFPTEHEAQGLYYDLGAAQWVRAYLRSLSAPGQGVLMQRAYNQRPMVLHKETQHVGGIFGGAGGQVGE